MKDIDFYLDEQQKRKDRAVTAPAPMPGWVLERMKKISQTGTQADRDHLLTLINESFRDSGRKLLARAIDEGIVTLKEWNEHDLTESDANPILMAYYTQKDGHMLDETIAVMTVERSNIWKHREWITNKFNVIVQTTKEAIKLIKKEKEEKAMKERTDPDKVKEIQMILAEVEQTEEVKILFAVENGSRSWNMHSKDSDYDVRFVYIRPASQYLRLEAQPETITRQYYHSKIDMIGFDIYKYLKLFKQSNPTMIEWIQSEIVYKGQIPLELHELAVFHYNPIALYHHYKSMCKQNYLKYIKSGKEVTFKKYLYAMRGLLNAKYVVQHAELPPIQFTHCIEGVNAPENVKTYLRDIIRLKREGQERTIQATHLELDRYIEHELQDHNDAPTTPRKMSLSLLEAFLTQVLEENTPTFPLETKLKNQEKPETQTPQETKVILCYCPRGVHTGHQYDPGACI